MHGRGECIPHIKGLFPIPAHKIQNFDNPGFQPKLILDRWLKNGGLGIPNQNKLSHNLLRMDEIHFAPPFTLLSFCFDSQQKYRNKHSGFSTILEHPSLHKFLPLAQTYCKARGRHQNMVNVHFFLLRAVFPKPGWSVLQDARSLNIQQEQAKIKVQNERKYPQNERKYPQTSALKNKT